jgi:hypothetical protein
MKMKKSILLAGLVLGVVAAPTVLLKKNSNVNLKPNMAVGFAEAFAADGGADSCRTAFEAVISAKPNNDEYTNKLLDHLHRELYRFNNIETADVEMIFCRMNSMGITADSVSSVAQIATKTDPLGNTIVATVITPTESWATTAGYTAKLTVTSGGTQFLAMWWAGTDTSTKGYLIQGNNPQHDDGNTRLRYALWDRTGDSQVLKFLGAQYTTAAGYLQTPVAATKSKSGGDHASYAKLTYNASTKAATGQQVEIRQGVPDKDQKDITEGTTTTFACVKTYFAGTIGGTISGYRPAKGMLLATTDANKDGTGMDGDADVTDATTTADHSGTPSAGSIIAANTFAYTCNGVYTANASGSVFYKSGSTTADVAYTTEPSTVFP